MFVQKSKINPLQKTSKADGVGILDLISSLLTKEEMTRYSSSSVPAMMQSAIESRRRRIAIYSYDIMSMEHMQRNMLIAQILANSPLKVDILLISGRWEASKVPLSPNVDCLTLPGLYKTEEGRCQARSLNISLQEITALRSQIIQVAIAGFKPDILIVDKAPRGAMQELDGALTYVRSQAHTRCVLGLYETLDEPVAAQRDWNCSTNEDVIRDYYDAIWIYGDPSDYNTAQASHFSHDVAAKIRYTGYLDQRSWIKQATAKKLEALLDLDLPPSDQALRKGDDGQDVTTSSPQEESTMEVHNSFDLNGRDRLPQLVAEILNRGPLE